MYQNELAHYGVKGMKWGVRRANRLQKKANIARESAKEWDEMSRTARSKGKTARADKYASNAKQDRIDAKRYETKIKRNKHKEQFADKRRDISASRQTGHRLATNLLAGAFANRTYNSVLASGGSRAKALGVTTVTGLIGGPVGHLVVSSLYSSDYADKKMR